MDIKKFMDVEKTSFQIIKFYYNFYMNKLNVSESDALSFYKGFYGFKDINYYLINNKFTFDEYFYYNSTYKSIRISSTIPGVCTITNQLGQIMMTFAYSAGAKWYSVAILPSDIYIATTQGKSIIFNK